jgi:hypothetical protein
MQAKNSLETLANTDSYCGVWSWPWQWVTREKADHPLLLTNNRCVPVTDTQDRSVVVFCAYMITQLFSLVFCVVIAMWPTCIWLEACCNIIYLLTAIRLTLGGSSTIHIFTQTIYRATQSTQIIHRTTQLTNWEECGLCPLFASYTLAFALHLRKKTWKNLS